MVTVLCVLILMVLTGGLVSAVAFWAGKGVVGMVAMNETFKCFGTAFGVVLEILLAAIDQN